MAWIGLLKPVQAIVCFIQISKVSFPYYISYHRKMVRRVPVAVSIG